MKIHKSNCKGADDNFEKATYNEESPYEDSKPNKPLNDLGLMDEKSSSQSQKEKNEQTSEVTTGFVKTTSSYVKNPEKKEETHVKAKFFKNEQSQYSSFVAQSQRARKMRHQNMQPQP